MIEPVRPAPALLTDAAAHQSYANALPVLQRLRDADHRAVLVGGGVRDLLLGRNPLDWDVATSATPDEILELWPEAIPTGIRHGTLTVLVAGQHIEVTTYRADGPYADARRPDWVRFGVTLEDDLERRDFTVNAMALDPHAATLIDPHGGMADLAGRILRTVGDPDQRFAEDALRPLRGARFSAVLEFTLDPATREAMARAAPGVAAVAPERVREELCKMLRARRPSVGLEILRETGILSYILPELLEGVGMEQNRHHRWTVYDHILRVVDAAPPDNERVRLAALFHDIGKPRTRREVDGEGTFHGHESVGADLTREIMERLRFSGDDTRTVTHLVAQHMFHYTPDWSDGAVRRFVQRAGKDRLSDLFALRVADNLGNGTKDPAPEGLEELRGRIHTVLSRDDALSREDLDVTGRDLIDDLGIPEGPAVGKLLDALLEHVLEEPERNEREHLLSLARELHDSA